MSLSAPKTILRVLAFVVAVIPAAAFGQNAGPSKDQVAPTLSSVHGAFTVFAPRGHRGGTSSNSRAQAGALPEIDSIQTFSGEFQASGVGPSGKPQRRWLYTMAGSRPEFGGTTVFDAPVIPVSLDLLDDDGSIRVVNGHKLHYSVQPFVGPATSSPIFR